MGRNAFAGFAYGMKSGAAQKRERGPYEKRISFEGCKEQLLCSRTRLSSECCAVGKRPEQKQRTWFKARGNASGSLLWFSFWLGFATECIGLAAVERRFDEPAVRVDFAAALEHGRRHKNK